MSNFNTVPDNMVELSESDWAQSDYFNYDPVNTERRQLLIADVVGKEIYHNFTLYHMPDGHGYAITNEYWNGRVRVFRFGCEHQWHELNYRECETRDIKHFGSCWHVEECAKCNQVRTYDSSG